MRGRVTLAGNGEAPAGVLVAPPAPMGAPPPAPAVPPPPIGSVVAPGAGPSDVGAASELPHDTWSKQAEARQTRRMQWFRSMRRFVISPSTGWCRGDSERLERR
jgi:hypothetical protein